MAAIHRMEIRDVWKNNLEQEFEYVRRMAEQYRFIGMDTEFPGVVATPMGEFRSNSDKLLQTTLCNANLLKLIQLGICFVDEKGNFAPICWQFNFEFSPRSDMFNTMSIEMLKSSGLNLLRNESEGIDPNDFAELLISSGLVLNPEITWIAFASSYDFCYLLRALSGQSLPYENEEFFSLLKIYFPSFYDVKYLMKSCKTLKGGLQDLANELKIPRIGQQHTAGSDSILTLNCFLTMRELFFENDIDRDKYQGVIAGFDML